MRLGEHLRLKQLAWLLADDLVALKNLALHRAALTATHDPVLEQFLVGVADAQIYAFEAATADPDVTAIRAGDSNAAVAATLGDLKTCEVDFRQLMASWYDMHE